MITNRAGIYVDATLGGGGHSAALLDALDDGARVLGIDRDADAIAAAEERLASDVARGRFTAVRGNFVDLKPLLEARGVASIDGLVVDLGVSSHQLDAAERGFSFAAEHTLDMRMDPRGALTAHDVVNAWSEQELRHLLFHYGEERAATRIARAIVRHRPLDTTTALADVVRSVVPTRTEVKTLARVFQAIRIAVNGELEALEALLLVAVHLVVPHGRIAVISYHSLEDRRVKRFFRYGNFEGRPQRDLFGNLLAPWRERTRHPVTPGEAEQAANPRSRSARMRVAERTTLEADEDK